MIPGHPDVLTDPSAPGPLGVTGRETAPHRAAVGYQEAVELFIGRTRHTKSGSRHTERAYRTDLRHLGRFLASDGLSVATVTRRDAERYLARLSTSAKPRTVQRRVYCIRSFYRFLRGIDLVASNPFDALDLPVFNRKSETHKVLSDDEVDRAVDALAGDVVASHQRFTEAEPGCERSRAFAALFTAARRRAAFTLMAFAGLRCEELLTLTAAAIVVRDDGFLLRFSGKGGKTRTVPMAGFAYPAMQDWLTVRRHVPTAATEIFITLNGRAVVPKQIERDCLRVGTAAETQHKLTPHVLRRTFGTRTLRETGDLRGTQELLGHASIHTTEVYTHVAEGNLRRLVESGSAGTHEHARGPVLAGDITQAATS